MASRFNPGKLFIRTRFNYEKLPGADSQASSPLPLFSSKSWGSRARQPSWASKVQRPRLSLARIITLLVALVVLVSMLSTGIYRRHRWSSTENSGDEKKQYHWEHYPR
jgi:hypothetical protein